MPKTRSNARSDTDTVIALKLIQDSLTHRGYPPTRREIAEACGWKSPSAGQDLIMLMEARGLIRCAPKIPRSLQITEAGMIALTESV